MLGNIHGSSQPNTTQRARQARNQAVQAGRTGKQKADYDAGQQNRMLGTGGAAAGKVCQPQSHPCDVHWVCFVPCSGSAPRRDTALVPRSLRLGPPRKHKAQPLQRLHGHMQATGRVGGAAPRRSYTSAELCPAAVAAPGPNQMQRKQNRTCKEAPVARRRPAACARRRAHARRRAKAARRSGPPSGARETVPLLGAAGAVGGRAGVGRSRAGRHARHQARAAQQRHGVARLAAGKHALQVQLARRRVELRARARSFTLGARGPRATTLQSNRRCTQARYTGAAHAAVERTRRTTGAGLPAGQAVQHGSACLKK